MVHRRSSRVRSPAAAGLFVSVGFVGCVQIFGFERPVSYCHEDSDCPLGEACAFGSCHVQCKDPSVCAQGQACTGAICVDSGPTVNELPDASPGRDACSCRLSCGSTGCSEGGPGCLFAWATPVGQGDPGPESTVWALSPKELWGQQIEIKSAGRLTGLGMYISVRTSDLPSSYYLGLYRDNGGGYPQARVWAPQHPLTMTSGAAKQEVEVPCTDPPVVLAPGFYWIVGIWDAFPLVLDVTPHSVPWASAALSAFAQPPDPFPNTWSNPADQPQDRAADFYAVVSE